MAYHYKLLGAIIMKNLLGLILTIIILFPELATAAGCEEYEAEAEAISGVVPRFNADGRLRSILIHGEATFLTNKLSLVNAARTKAELSAKQAFSSFLNESVSAAQKAKSLLEQAELTDQDGNTEGQAIELTSVVTSMQSNTSAVMNGIIKLDECVDTDGKYILVTLGWKPEQSAQLDATTKSPSSLNLKSKKQFPEAEHAEVQEDGKIESKQCVNSVRIETVNSTGYGQDQNAAISDGLRVAVSQVFGETFASSITISSSTVTAEVADAQGNSQGLAAEVSAQSQNSSSETAGIVRSYAVTNIARSGQSFEIKLTVDLPKYCSDDDSPNKKKTVVLKPSVFADRDWTRFGDKLAETIQMELETLLNETIDLSVLSRRDDAAISAELNSININDFSIDDLAKKGNKLAADYIVVTEFSDFDTKKIRVKVGPKKPVEMYVTSAQAWVRVVDVVTTRLVASIRVPLTSKSIFKENNLEAFSITMAHNMATVIGERVGGGFNEVGASLLAASANKLNNYATAKERLKTIQDKIKKDIEDDW
jgi:hypothetical protein